MQQTTADAIDGAKDTGKVVENLGQAGKITDDGSIIWKNADGVAEQIDGKGLDELPDHMQDIYGRYKNHKWKGNVTGQAEGTRAGGVFKDKFNDFPSIESNGNAIIYREFDVNDYIPGQSRDAERLIVGSDGNIYYTNDHYSSFARIKGE